MRRVWEKEIDGGVIGWEKEGDWKERERERRGSETDVPKLYPTMNMNSLWGAPFIPLVTMVNIAQLPRPVISCSVILLKMGQVQT